MSGETFDVRAALPSGLLNDRFVETLSDVQLRLHVPGVRDKRVPVEGCARFDAGTTLGGLGASWTCDDDGVEAPCGVKTPCR